MVIYSRKNSQDSKNPTEKPETENKISHLTYRKCCLTFEDHENSMFLQCVVVPIMSTIILTGNLTKKCRLPF